MSKTVHVWLTLPNRTVGEIQVKKIGKTEWLGAVLTHEMVRWGWIAVQTVSQRLDKT